MFVLKSRVCFLLCRFVLLWLLLAVTHLHAAESPSIFEVQVRVPDESSAVQRGAFTRGLQQVLIRLSGDSRVLQKLKLPPASRYVKQYRYDKLDSELDQSGVAVQLQQLQLWMQFDADKVEQLLRQNNLPVWNAQRDGMVVWLAVRDGAQHYLLKRSDRSLIKDAVEQVAAERGLPVVWPLYDQADRKIVRFADVWAGFTEPLLQASQRYASGAVLVGNLSWNGSGWVSDWSLLDAGKDIRRSYKNIDYATVISAALNEIADDLGSRYALLDDTGSTDARQARVEIKGVDNIEHYRQAEKLLASMAPVRSTRLAELYDDFAVFHVSLRTSIDDFIQRMNRQRQFKSLPVPVTTVTATPASTSETAATASAASALPVASPLPVYRYQLKPATSL